MFAQHDQDGVQARLFEYGGSQGGQVQAGGQPFGHDCLRTSDLLPPHLEATGGVDVVNIGLRNSRP